MLVGWLVGWQVRLHGYQDIINVDGWKPLPLTETLLPAKKVKFYEMIASHSKPKRHFKNISLMHHIQYNFFGRFPFSVRPMSLKKGNAILQEPASWTLSP